MDISSLAFPDLSGTHSHEVTLPGSNQKTGLVLHIQSMASEAVKTVSKRHDGRILRQSASHEGLSSDELDLLAGESMASRKFDMTCTAVTGWEWGKDEKGEPFVIKGEVWEFSQSNLERLFKEFPFIQMQAQREAEKVENFTKS